MALLAPRGLQAARVFKGAIAARFAQAARGVFRAVEKLKRHFKTLGIAILLTYIQI